MTYTITVVPASTQAGRETIRVLLEDESQPLIRAFYRDLSKAPIDFTNHPNFTGIQGDVSTSPDLDFGGSDAVLYIPPPPYYSGETDTAEFATAAANNVKVALDRAPSVKRLLLFSSIGAEHDHGIGILKINHISDKILQVSAPEVAIVKPGYFQESWTQPLETTKADPPVFHSPLTPIDHKIPMVSLQDISRICARKLLDLSTPLPKRTFVFELFGPRHYSTGDVQAAMEEVMGKKVNTVLFEKDQLAEYWTAYGIPNCYLEEMGEFTSAALPGGVMADKFDGDENTVWGQVELIDVLRKAYAA
ncbi:NmrA family protein [Colletotrichum truncatum]|uniref:NmrA family protein n=1 Tax=Colletotrichum truncatum TaxID=5467 RepID=A0ACC3YH84_COLTU|nr:NmrA family protein [Colletotrichum truncatum]KAF6792791.1 NmrA family protein [Colletotrichum truncatum]